MERRMPIARCVVFLRRAHSSGGEERTVVGKNGSCPNIGRETGHCHGTTFVALPALAQANSRASAQGGGPLGPGLVVVRR